MTKEVAMLLGPGDIVLGKEDIYRVAGNPEIIILQKKRTVRVPVSDPFGKTQVLVREDIIRCLRKAAKKGNDVDTFHNDRAVPNRRLDGQRVAECMK